MLQTGAELAPNSPGFVLLDSEWHVIAANAEAAAALNAGGKAGSDAAQQVFQDLANEAARRARSGTLPETFSYAGCTCSVLRFSCAFGNPGEFLHALLIGPPVEDSSFVTSFGQTFRLTPRETEALGLCLKGLGAKQIAQQMKISVSTAKSFLRLVSIKMGVTSRAEILSKVLDSMCEASLACPFRSRRG